MLEVSCLGFSESQAHPRAAWCRMHMSLWLKQRSSVDFIAEAIVGVAGAVARLVAVCKVQRLQWIDASTAALTSRTCLDCNAQHRMETYIGGNNTPLQ